MASKHYFKNSYVHTIQDKDEDIQITMDLRDGFRSVVVQNLDNHIKIEADYVMDAGKAIKTTAAGARSTISDAITFNGNICTIAGGLADITDTDGEKLLITYEENSAIGMV